MHNYILGGGAVGNGGEGHTGQHRPGGVIGLSHVGRRHEITAQSGKTSDKLKSASMTSKLCYVMTFMYIRNCH